MSIITPTEVVPFDMLKARKLFETTNRPRTDEEWDALSAAEQYRTQRDAVIVIARPSLEIVIELYKMVFPNWEDIESMEGYPRVSRETNLELAGLCMRNDRAHFPAIFPGGAWLNNGFGTLDPIPQILIGRYDWVMPCPYRLKEKVTST